MLVGVRRMDDVGGCGNPSGNDDVFGFDNSLTGVEPIPVHDGLQARDGHALSKVGVDVLSEALEIVHN